MIPAAAPHSDGRKPRLAYVFSRYPVVSQTFCDNEILALEAAGWEVIVCSLNPPKDDFRHARLSDLRAPILHTPPPLWQKALQTWAKEDGTWPTALLEKHRTAFDNVWQPEDRCRNVIYFAQQLQYLGVDHVHVHFANRSTHSVLFLKELTGIPFSFTPQAQDFLVDLESPALLSEMCQQAEFVVTACDDARAKLVALCPESRDKIVRIYNGIDPPAYPHASPQPTPDRLRISSVGRLIEFKGFHILMEAMALTKAEGLVVDLELIGDGPWKGQLTELAAKLGIEDQVHFLGTMGIDGMKACFQRSDVFALACILSKEGASDMLPTVITEAMLCRLPVLSSRLAGIPEQVVDGVTGILTEPADVPAVASALLRLAREPGLAQRLGEAGLQRARDHFAVQKTLPMLEAQIQNSPAKGQGTFGQASEILAYYDLTITTSVAALEAEASSLHKRQAQVWLSGHLPSHAKVPIGPDAVKHAYWLPDGMALEMEWQSRPAERAKLEALRTELSTAVEGEPFLEAARRALWISLLIPRLGGGALLYASGWSEALTLWMVYRLTGLPLQVNLSADAPPGFEKKLRDRLLKESHYNGPLLP